MGGGGVQFFKRSEFGLHSLKTLSNESINRSLVCAHKHSITQTHKMLTFMSGPQRVNASNDNNKNTQHTPFMKTEYDHLYGWTKKWSHTQKSLKMVNPRDTAEISEEFHDVRPCEFSSTLCKFVRHQCLLLHKTDQYKSLQSSLGSKMHR